MKNVSRDRFFDTPQHFKYLASIILDPKLSWKPHIEYLRNKASKATRMLKSLSLSKWGGDPSTFIISSKSLEVSWNTAPLYSHMLLRPPSSPMLLEVQNRSVRLALGATKTTPIPALQFEAKIPSPLLLRRLHLIEQYVLRALSYSHIEILK